MKKLMTILMLSVVVIISQVIFAQEKPVKKKVEKTMKVDTTVECKHQKDKSCSKSEGKDTKGCCKDKKCCEKCSGKKCDGKCCDMCKEKCKKHEIKAGKKK